MNKKSQNTDLPNEPEQMDETIEEVTEQDVETESSPLELSEDEQKIVELESQLNEEQQRYLRLLAEYDNFRKRTNKERDEIYPNAIASTVEKFLPMIDNFQRANEYDSSTPEYAQGIEMIFKSLQEILNSLHVESFGTVGDPFDPAFYSAVMHIEDPELGDNVVSQVFQPGYRIGDRVIRHAVVQTAN